MREGALLVVCAVAACGGSGVDVEIVAPDGMQLDRVELWVAYDPCYDCPNGVAWQSDGERASGEIYYLRDEALVTATPHGDRWVLHLEAVAGNRDPGWIAVAGFQGDQVTAIKVLRDVHIPSTTVAIWQVYLHPAEPASTDVTTAPGDAARDHRALVWARPPTPALADPTGCLAYQAWSGDAWESEYFVPPSDPDCDGIPAEQECSEYWYHYKPLGRCVTDAGATLPDACVVGRSPCADGITNDRTCGEEPPGLPTCLPDEVCSTCGDDIPADGCVSQTIEDGIDADSLLHYHCYFDANEQNAPCPDQSALVQFPISDATCATPLLHYLDRPFTEPQSALVFGTGPAQIKLSLVTDTTMPCRYALTWIGGTQDAFASGLTFLVEVPYTNGLRALYPVQILPSNQTITCTDPPAPPHACEPGGPMDDGLLRCAAH